jgi:hypothetical protein
VRAYCTQRNLPYVSDYPYFSPTCATLVVQYLTESLYEAAEGYTTRYGYTLSDAIRAAVEIPNPVDLGERASAYMSPHYLPIQQSGIVAGDGECYDLYRDVYWPIIRDIHAIHGETIDMHIFNVLYTESQCVYLRNVESHLVVHD